MTSFDVQTALSEALTYCSPNAAVALKEYGELPSFSSQQGGGVVSPSTFHRHRGLFGKITSTATRYRTVVEELYAAMPEKLIDSSPPLCQVLFLQCAQVTKRLIAQALNLHHRKSLLTSPSIAPAMVPMPTTTHGRSFPHRQLEKGSSTSALRREQLAAAMAVLPPDVANAPPVLPPTPEALFAKITSEKANNKAFSSSDDPFDDDENGGATSEVSLESAIDFVDGALVNLTDMVLSLKVLAEALVENNNTTKQQQRQRKAGTSGAGIGSNNNNHSSNPSALQAMAVLKCILPNEANHRFWSRAFGMDTLVVGNAELVRKLEEELPHLVQCTKKEKRNHTNKKKNHNNSSLSLSEDASAFLRQEVSRDDLLLRGSGQPGDEDSGGDNDDDVGRSLIHALVHRCMDVTGDGDIQLVEFSLLFPGSFYPVIESLFAQVMNSHRRATEAAAHLSIDERLTVLGISGGGEEGASSMPCQHCAHLEAELLLAKRVIADLQAQLEDHGVIADSTRLGAHRSGLSRTRSSGRAGGASPAPSSSAWTVQAQQRTIASLQERLGLVPVSQRAESTAYRDHKKMADGAQREGQRLKQKVFDAGMLTMRESSSGGAATAYGEPLESNSSVRYHEQQSTPGLTTAPTIYTPTTPPPYRQHSL